MNAKTKSNSIKAAALLLVLAVILLAGIGTTAAAAQKAIPGDTLYTIKTTFEQSRLSLAQDARDRAELHMAFAERRLGEILALVEQGRHNEIGGAVLDFETEINAAILELQQVSSADPAGAASLAASITETLTRYAQTLSTLASQVPASLQADLTRASDSAQIAGGLGIESREIEITGAVESITAVQWTIGGRTVAISSTTEIKGAIQVGDFVKAHVRIETDQSLTAREIELTASGAGENENANGNANGNMNGNDNGNDNGNANGNSNSNMNGNDNGNANGNSNDNGNTNGNDNGNTNGDDNGNMNGNDNGNTNGNDNSNANGNTNGNDNGNTNGDDHGGNGNGNDDDDDDDDNGNTNGDD